jgi:hypothetical protein
MRKFILGLLALLALGSTAGTQTLPANTVVGRLSIGPGPAQAIPFSTLAANLSVAPLSVTAAGAKCDGSTDDTAAFQSALNTIAAVGAGILYIPPSASGCKVGSSPITYAGLNLRITGGGTGALLTKTTTTGDLFQFSGLNGIELDNFSINAGGSATTGVLFNFTNTTLTAGNFWVHDIQLLGGWDHILFAGGQNTIVTNVILQFFNNTAIHYGSSYAGIGIISNSVIAATNTSGFGIVVEKGDTFTFSNMNVQHCGTPIYVHPAASGGFVKNLYATGVLADGAGCGAAGGNGWFFDGSNAGATLERIHLSNVWAGAKNGDGFLFNTVQGVAISNSRAITNNGQGFHFTGTNTGVRLIGNVAEGNSAASSNTNDGFRIDAGMTDLIMIGNRSGLESSSDAGNTQKYGIDFTAGTATRANLIGNNVNGNVTAGINSALNSAAGNRVESNIGYNPVGGSNITVTASPFTYTAGPSPETVYINGGTISQTVTAGIQIGSAAANSGITAQLGPNESVTVTYSVAPNMAKSIH